MPTAKDYRALEFDARQLVRELRRRVFEAGQLDTMTELAAAERELQQLSEQRAEAELAEAPDDGRIVGFAPASNLLGPKTTGIEMKVDLRMASVPTALVHLFDRRVQPLVSYEVTNNNNATK